MSTKKANVYRFRDYVAATLPASEQTDYMSAAEARQIAAALNRVADELEAGVPFGEASQVKPVTIEIAHTRMDNR